MQALKSNKSLRKLLAISFILIILIAALTNNMLSIKKYSVLKDNLNQDILESKTQVARLENIAKDEKKIAKQIAQLEKFLPQGSSQEDLHFAINEIGSEYKVDFLKVSFSEVSDAEQLKMQPMSVSIIGNYTDVMSMLESFVLDYRLILLEDINIELNDSNKVSVDAVMNVYYR